MRRSLALWIGGTLRYAARTRVTPGSSGTMTIDDATSAGNAAPSVSAHGAERMGLRDAIVLLIIAGAFAVYVYGTLRLDWGFNEMAGLFFAMGVVAGLSVASASKERRKASCAASARWRSPG